MVVWDTDLDGGHRRGVVVEAGHWRWQGWPSADEARSTEAVLQLLRGAAVVWLLLQVAADLDMGLVGAQVIRAVAAATAVGGMVALAWARSRATSPRRAMWLTIGGFAFDAILLLGAVSVAGVVGGRQPWESLLFLVALGGIRLQLPGAAAGWLLAMAGFVAIPFLFEGESLSWEELIYQAGLAALMGLLFGLLSAAHRDARQEALEHLRELRRLDAWRSRLLGALAHDLRSPQAAEIALAETLHLRDQEMDGETRRQLAARIVTQGRRAERLLDDLLTMAQSDHEGLVVHPRLVELLPAVQNAVHATGVEAEIDVPAGLRARIDPERCQQVLTNLLTNAQRYGVPPVTVTGRADPDGDIRIAVSDHGPGVDAADQPDLFEAFSHGGHTESVGLGLWIAHEVVTAHGGTITYRDNQPHGATFEIRLPQTRT